MSKDLDEPVIDEDVRKELDSFNQPTYTKEKFQKFKKFIFYHRKLKFFERLHPDCKSKKKFFSFHSKDGSVEIRLMDAKISVSPDDRVYCNKKIKDSRKIRDLITRGCILLEIVVNDEGKTQEMYKLFQGYSKFSGITETDDDDLVKMLEKDKQQKKDKKEKINLTDLFFSGKKEDATHLVSMNKENGKAGHFACFKVKDEVFYLGGSKNVHIIFQNLDDLKVHKQDVLHVDFCTKMMKFLEKMDQNKRKEMEEFLCRTELMVNFEYMKVNDQHVVDYKLEEDLLTFLSFTARRDAGEDYKKKYGKCFHPLYGLMYAKYLGFSIPKYEHVEFSPENLKKMLDSIRTEHNTEGRVIYFMKEKKTFGLWKVKSLWYIFLRAIREKLVRGTLDYNKLVGKRCIAIQKWTGCSNEEILYWKYYGYKLQIFVRKTKNINDKNEIRSKYAVLISEFMKDFKKPENLKEAVKEIVDENFGEMKGNDRYGGAQQNKKQNGKKNNRNKRNNKEEKKNEKEEEKKEEKKEKEEEEEKSEKKTPEIIEKTEEKKEEEKEKVEIIIVEKKKEDNAMKNKNEKKKVSKEEEKIGDTDVVIVEKKQKFNNNNRGKNKRRNKKRKNKSNKKKTDDDIKGDWAKKRNVKKENEEK